MGSLVFQATLGGSTTLTGPNIAGNNNFNLPSADGTSGQALRTDGAGTLSFGTLAIAGGGTNGTATPTAGAIAYGTGTAYAFNTAGTSGQALLSGGAGVPTFGTLGVAAGGTGQTTYTDGQLLIGNTTGNTLTKSTLTAGSGISITNGSGSITIAATGGGMVYPGAGIPLSTGSAWGTSFTNAGNPITTAYGGTGLSSFTANRVFYASSTSAIAQSANLTFNGTTLTAADFTDSSLTAGRITYAGTGGNLVDSAGLTFDGTNFTTTGIATAARFVPSGSTVATNGMYLPAANSIGISTNSVQRINVDSSGNVNIATTGVSAKLYVSGNAAQNISALTDGATITADFSVANNFSVTLGGNRTLANPTNLIAGQSGVIFITQDGTGGRTLAYGTSWDFPNQTAPTLTTAANAVDVLVYSVRSSTSIAAQLLNNIGP